jgi:hypothetical protein
VEDRPIPTESFEAVSWPLTGSFVLTAIVVSIFCVPPMRPLHSWGQLLALACTYILIAACVHTLAIWSICRLQGDRIREWVVMWPVVWGAWIAVVWLPLLALLTSEHSRWVALVLPITGVFVCCFVSAYRSIAGEEAAWSPGDGSSAALFEQPESPRVWRMLVPSFVSVLLTYGGLASYAGGHAWRAGAFFAAAAMQVAHRLLQQMPTGEPAVSGRSLRRTAAGNSVAVWMLTVLALLPFLASIGVAMRGWMGMPGVRAADHLANYLRGATHGYVGIILTRPKMRHEIVTPVLTANPEGFRKQNKMIPFDGQYWYFQDPAVRPGPNPHIVQGDPTKKQIASTDRLPIVMEAHQKLRTPMEAHCCRALQLNLVNADAVPGSITLEVQLRDEHGYVASLGDKVLASSTVAPMPLHRAPVKETLLFQLPRGAKDRAFDEITVKIKPERSRSLAAPKVAIDSFAFQQ